MALPLAAMFLVDEVVPNQQWSWFWAVVIVYCATSLFLEAGKIAQRYLALKVRTQLYKKISFDFYNQLLHLPYKVIRSRSVGAQSFRTTSDIPVVVELLSTLFTSLTSSALSLVVAITIMVNLQPWITVIFIITVPLAFLARIYVSLKLRPTELLLRECNEDISGYLADSLAAVREIKTAGTEAMEAERYRNMLAQNVSLEWTLWRKNVIFGKLQAFLESGIGTLLQWWIWFLVMKQFSTIGTAMAMSWYFGRVTGPFISLATGCQQIVSAMAPGERILEVLEPLVEATETDNGVPLEGPVRLISLSNVSFSYDDQPPVFQNISMEMQPGQLHFIMGASGVGKTTLLNLLCALYTGYRGRIEINDIDLNQVAVASLHKSVRMLGQDTLLFRASIRENISYGSENPSQGRVERAARHAAIHDRICQLEHGYDTLLLPGFCDLSQGERQRLGIARLLASDAQVLLFDEPFSNLDTAVEHKIIQTLRQYYTDRILMIVTHRHDVIESHDRVYDLSDNGLFQQQVLETFAPAASFVR